MRIEFRLRVSQNHISCSVSAYKTLKPLGLTRVQAKCFFYNSVAAITPMSCLWECYIILALLQYPYTNKVTPWTPTTTGIVSANTLQIQLALWFTFNIQQYIWEMEFIPNTQIAAKNGARVGNMTSFINGLDGFAKHCSKIYPALKQDEKKGFNYLSKLGFKHACMFFGLPVSVFEFETAQMQNVVPWVKCFNSQLSNPIYTSGQTKQGDPFSLMKYCLTTAMAAWWIQYRHPTIGLRLTTPNGPKPHSATDYLDMIIRLVAATKEKWNTQLQPCHMCNYPVLFFMED